LDANMLIDTKETREWFVEMICRFYIQKEKEKKICTRIVNSALAY